MIRRFRREDWLGAVVLCPHCNQQLTIIDADGPHIGFNPQLLVPDLAWVVTLSDGYEARMWEDRKGIVIEEDP